MYRLCSMLAVVALLSYPSAVVAQFGRGGGGGPGTSPANPGPRAPLPRGGENQHPGTGGAPIPYGSPQVVPSQQPTPSGGGGSAPTDSTGLAVRVCNRSSSVATVAVGYKRESEWVAEGWWTVKTSTCTGALVTGINSSVYMYATSSDGGIWVPDVGQVKFCVDVRDPFDLKDAKCGSMAHSDYEWRTFGKLVRDPVDGMLTWTLGD
jgi:uncharacterized membrane protein